MINLLVILSVSIINYSYYRYYIFKYHSQFHIEGRVVVSWDSPLEFPKFKVAVKLLWFLNNLISSRSNLTEPRSKHFHGGHTPTPPMIIYIHTIFCY